MVKRFTIFFVFCFWLLILSPSLLAKDPTPFGTVANLKGKVTLQRKFKKVPIQIGTALFNGDVVRTDKESSLDILIDQGNQMHIHHNSRMTLNANAKNAKQEDDFEIIVEQGSIRSQLNKLNGRKVKIKTPVAVVGVRGTDFIVRYNPNAAKDQVYSVSVIEGQVDVTSLIKVNNVFQKSVVGGKQRIYVSDQGTLDKIQALTPQDITQLETQFKLAEIKVNTPENNSNNDSENKTTPNKDQNSETKDDPDPSTPVDPNASQGNTEDEAFDSNDYVDQQFDQIESNLNIQDTIKKTSSNPLPDIQRQIDQVNEEVQENVIEEILDNTKKDRELIRLRIQFQLED